MKFGRPSLVTLCIRSAASCTLFTAFTTLSVLFLLHESLLRPRPRATKEDIQAVSVTVWRCWGALLLFVLTHAVVSVIASLLALGVIDLPSSSSTGFQSSVWWRLRSLASSSWLSGPDGVPLFTSGLFLLLCLPLIGPAWLSGLWVALSVFVWLALEARCTFLVGAGERRRRASSSSSPLSTSATTTATGSSFSLSSSFSHDMTLDRSTRRAVLSIGQASAAVVVSCALYVLVRPPSGSGLTPAMDGTNTTRAPSAAPAAPRTRLTTLHVTAGAVGVLATVAVVTVAAGALRDGRQSPSPSRRRPEAPPQTPLTGSTDAFRSFAAKSSQRPSMQSALLLAATVRFSEITTSTGFTWFLLSCGAKRVDGLTLAALMLCSWGLPSICVWVAELFEVRASFTKLNVLLLLLARSVLGGALLVAQFFFVGEAALDHTATTTSTLSAADGSSRAAQGTPRNGLATLISLLVLNRVAVTLLVQRLPRVWEDVVKEDKVLFNRSTAMTAATARLSWAVTQPFQAAALLLLAVVTFALNQPRLGDGAHFADASGQARRVIAVIVGLAELCAGGAMALLWSRTYNLTGQHMQFVELGTYEMTESEQPV